MWREKTSSSLSLVSWAVTGGGSGLLGARGFSGILTVFFRSRNGLLKPDDINWIVPKKHEKDKQVLMNAGEG
jgi:hypothetical protein